MDYYGFRPVNPDQLDDYLSRLSLEERKDIDKMAEELLGCVFNVGNYKDRLLAKDMLVKGIVAGRITFK